MNERIRKQLIEGKKKNDLARKTRIPKACAKCGHVMAFPEIITCPHCRGPLEEV